MRSLLEQRSKAAQQKEIQDEFLSSNDTICRQVSNREPQLKKFSAAYDVIIFVKAVKKLQRQKHYEVCRSVNPRSYFNLDVEELLPEWIQTSDSVGICGATTLQCGSWKR